MKESVVRARIEQSLKADAEQVLAQEGLQMSDAIRLFLQHVVQEQGLPFKSKPLPERAVSGKHLRAIKRKQQARDHARGKGKSRSVDALLIRPHRMRGVEIQWPKTRLRDGSK